MTRDIDVCQHRPVSIRPVSPSAQPSPGTDSGSSGAHPYDPELGATPACTPSALVAQPMDRGRAEVLAPLLKALADPVRLRLMSLIACHTSAEACVCDLTPAFELSQPTVSHHLKVLHEAGLVERERRGVWIYYRLHPRASRVLDALSDLDATVGASR